MINQELKRREELVMDENFRKKCIEFCKEIGITAKEWNENKMAICLMIANRFCKFEDELKK